MNEYHKNHKLMWNELARTGGESKLDVFQKLSLPNAECRCFACREDRAIRDTETCMSCPISWVKGFKGYCICDSDEKSPYYKWEHAKTPRTRKKYAKIIANMNWRTKK
jgi:hypothetical protein